MSPSKSTDRVAAILIVAVAVILVPVADAATDEPRFRFRLGGFFSSLETTIRLDTEEELGTEINFETTLGLPDSESLPFVELDFRLGRRHKIGLHYFQLQRTGFSEVVNIRFGDEEFTVPTDVNAFFDTNVLQVYYGYAIVKKERATFGLAFGLNVQDLSAGVASVDGAQEEDGEATAPLPTFGIFGSHTMGKKWTFGGVASVFALEVGGIKGAIYIASAQFYHATFKHIGFGAGYDFFRLDVDADADDFGGSLRYEYQGPTVFLIGWF